MEVLFSFVLPMLWAVSSAAIVFCLLSLIIKKLRGKETRKTVRRLAVSFACMVVAFFAIGVTTPEIWESEAPAEPEEVIEPEVVVELGADREHPFVLTADELAAEINADIDAAKAKYNGKWVKITGTVTDYSRYSADDLSGYYLYGNYGVEGLRIVCWQNKGAWKQNEKIGDVCTCVGQVREITTFNATEIGDCEITFE